MSSSGGVIAGQQIEHRFAAGAGGDLFFWCVRASQRDFETGVNFPSRRVAMGAQEFGVSTNRREVGRVLLSGFAELVASLCTLAFGL